MENPTNWTAIYGSLAAGILTAVAAIVGIVITNLSHYKRMIFQINADNEAKRLQRIHEDKIEIFKSSLGNIGRATVLLGKVQNESMESTQRLMSEIQEQIASSQISIFLCNYDVAKKYGHLVNILSKVTLLSARNSFSLNAYSSKMAECIERCDHLINLNRIDFEHLKESNDEKFKEECRNQISSRREEHGQQLEKHRDLSRERFELSNKFTIESVHFFESLNAPLFLLVNAMRRDIGIAPINMKRLFVDLEPGKKESYVELSELMDSMKEAVAEDLKSENDSNT